MTNKNLITKYFKIILLIFFIIFSIFYYIIGVDKECKTLRIINAINDFGVRHVVPCFSYGDDLTGRFKYRIKNNSFFYNFFVNIDKSLKKNQNRIDSINTQNSKFKDPFLDLKKTEIRGIYSNDSKLFNNTKINLNQNVEYNSWLRSHGGNWNTHFLNDSSINTQNVKNLELAWKHKTIKKNKLKKKWKQNIEINPVYLDGNLFYISSNWKLYALDVKTGNVIWEKECLFAPGRRGITLSKEKNENYIFVPIGPKVYKVNAKNGLLDNKFNNGKGYVWSSTSITAPMIYKDKLALANVGADPSISIYNKFNGNLIKKINLHSDKRNFGGGTPWGGVAIDSELGIVYINTGNPLPTTYGVHRPGKNKNSNSLIAISLIDEKILWSFQETAHDLWNFDIPSPPILHDLRINNKTHKVVISVTKKGNTIILDRVSGRNIYDYYLKETPKSLVEGEFVSPYQKVFPKPEPFSKTEFGKKDIDKLPIKKQEEILEKLVDAEYGWSKPPSFGKSLIMYGMHGGAEWMGAAIDPVNQDLYIPTINTPYVTQMYMISTETNVLVGKEFSKELELYNSRCSSCHGKTRNGNYKVIKDIIYEYKPSLVGLTLKEDTKRRLNYKNFKKKHPYISIQNDEYKKIIKLFKNWDKVIFDKNLIQASNYDWYEFLTKDKLPASNPPWGYITKLNLVTGNIEWKRPVGYLNGEIVGTPSFGGIALNSGGVIFSTGTEDNKSYALDKASGKILWSYDMEASGTAPPTIYTFEGKQYVSFLSNGGGAINFKNRGSTLYTFTIK